MLCHREPRQLERGAGATAEDDLGASPRVPVKRTLGCDGFARYCVAVAILSDIYPQRFFPRGKNKVRW